MKAARQFAAVLLVTAAIVGIGIALLDQGHSRAAARAAHAARSHALAYRMRQAALRQATCRTIPAGPLAGVAVKTPVGRNFADATRLARTHFALAEFYVRFGRPFPRQEALEAAAGGAVPVIQINPRTVSLTAIADGQWDTYLHAYAAAAARFGCRVVLSFGHEMNGTWYPWGCRHVPAQTFISAWRHIVGIVHGPEITWMWTTNVSVPGAHCSLASHWPGARYVDWVGVDGYLRTSAATFTNTFAGSLRTISQLAGGKPVLLAETGASPGPAQARNIAAIYAGAIRARVRGVIYFDTTGKLADYQPQQNPAALAAFQHGLAAFTKPAG
jgi:hypothetical protein